MHKRALNKQDQSSTDSVERPDHFGIPLKEERLRQGLSIEEISLRTGIKAGHILAIEEGNRRKLPADVFNRGFLRIYAGALNIDSKNIVESYEQEWGFSNGLQGDGPILAGEKMAESTSPFADRQFLTFLAAVILAASGFLGYKAFFPKHDIFQQLKNAVTETRSIIEKNIAPLKKPPTPDKETAFRENNYDSPDAKTSLLPAGQDEPSEKKPEEDVPSSNEIEAVDPLKLYTPDEQSEKREDDSKVTDASDLNAVKEQETATEAAISEGRPLDSEKLPSAQDLKLQEALIPEDEATPQYVLQAHFTERTWLRISIDDQDPAEYTFTPEESHTWSAETAINLFLGNAGGVQLSLNGEPILLKKKSGQTLKLSLP